jgi:hypothetical protein
MDEVHRSHVRERDQLTDDIEESSTSIDMCKDRVKGLEEQYRFFPLFIFLMEQKYFFQIHYNGI